MPTTLAEWRIAMDVMFERVAGLDVHHAQALSQAVRRPGKLDIEIDQTVAGAVARMDEEAKVAGRATFNP
jgi:hypothetical protein